MKITVIYQEGRLVRCRVLDVASYDDSVGVWNTIGLCGIRSRDVWYIFNGECVPILWSTV